MRKVLYSLLPLLMMVLALVGANAAHAAPKDKNKEPVPIPQVPFTIDGKPGTPGRLKALADKPLEYIVDQQGNLAVFTTKAQAQQFVNQLPDSQDQAAQQGRPAVESRDTTNGDASTGDVGTAACVPPLYGYTTLHDSLYFCNAFVDINVDVGNLSSRGFDNRASSLDNARSTATRYWSGTYYTGYALRVPAYRSYQDLTPWGFNNIISSVDVNTY